MRRSTLVPLLLLTAAARAGAVDLMIRQRVTGRGPGVQPHEETLYLTPTRQISDAPRDRTVVNFETKTMTWVDKERKAYFVTTFDEMRRENEATQERLKEMPSVARQMMGMDTPVTFKPTGKREKIAGYEAKEYTAEGGFTTGTVWVTDAFEPPAAAREWQHFAAAAGARSGPGGRLAEAMAQLRGLPLRSALTTTMGPVKITLESEALEVTERSPPAEVLTAPNDYRKMPAPHAEED